jgi:hypothetical protein
MVTLGVGVVWIGCTSDTPAPGVDAAVVVYDFTQCGGAQPVVDGGFNPACADCICQTCPMQASTCDEACWALTRCATEQGCLGDPADVAGEVGCVQQKCAMFAGALSSIIALDGCIVQAADTTIPEQRACTSVCRP